jgi:hypothetical protein
VTLRLIPGRVRRETGPGSPARPAENDQLEAITARIQKVFDPAGILRW